MKKIKDILKRKMRFLLYSVSGKDYYTFETEFIDFIFEIPELTEVMRRIVLKQRIPLVKLNEMFTWYLVTHAMYEENEKLVFPNFYNDEVERKTSLFKTFAEMVREARKSEIPPYDEVAIKKSIIETYNRDNVTSLRKLYLDIIQEIDLLDTEIYTSKANTSAKGFSFNEENGVLNFAGKKIHISKRKQITNAVLLMRTLVGADADEWLERGEILEDWGLTKDDRDSATRNMIFYAGKVINQFIKDETGVSDFVECTTLRARINPKYRS